MILRFTNYRPIFWIDVSLSYSCINSNLKTYCVALRFFPCWINFFIGIDYLLSKFSSDFIPMNSSAADFYLGMSILIRKRHK